MASPLTNSRNSRGRIVQIISDADPSSPRFKAALFRIGTLIRNRAVAKITEQGAVDEGFLRASIAFKIESSGDISTVTVGAFGVKHARIVEFGGAFTDQMRKAMFASFRNQGKPKRPGKGIISGGFYRARPYLGPAVRQSRGEVKGILKSVMRGV